MVAGLDTWNIETWNTRRSYTLDGQRIAAVAIGETIYFTDIDRYIDGIVTKQIDRSPDHRFIRSSVMICYDENKYTDWTPTTEEMRSLRKELQRIAKEGRNREW